MLQRDLQSAPRRSPSPWSASTSSTRTPTSRSTKSLDHAGIALTSRVAGAQDRGGGDRDAKGPSACWAASTASWCPAASAIAASPARSRPSALPANGSIPFFGICLGLQCAVIEFARNVVGLEDANTTEIDPNCQHPVVCMLNEQYDITHLGGTMRLGLYPCALLEGSQGAAAYERLADSRTASAPLRVQQPLPQPVRRQRPVLLGHQPGRQAGRGDRDRRTIRGSWRCSAIRSSSRSRRRRIRCSAASSRPPGTREAKKNADGVRTRTTAPVA